MEQVHDALIIGGGVIGCAVANRLSRYELDTVLLEKGSDVCAGSSKANSGVVHSGIYSQPGSQKAKLCLKGNKMYDSFTRDLGVEFKRIGKLIVARDPEEEKALKRMKNTGEKNEVSGLELIGEKRLGKLEPKIRSIKALYVPSAGIVSPYKLTIALAENSNENGVFIHLNSEVLDISEKKGYFEVKTRKMTFKTRWIINCAGLHCDMIAGMVGITKHEVYPCRGEYLVLDKRYFKLIKHLIYPPPENGSGGLGVHLTPTLEGNILIGPTATYIKERGDSRTTKEAITRLLVDTSNFLKELPRDSIIQSYAGIRCKLVPEGSTKPGDFVIEEDKKVNRFINIMGIESPGLSAAPAIAQMVVDLIKAKEDLKEKEGFIKRTYTPRFHKQELEAKGRLIEKDPCHGHLLCRCENVTQREIMDALENPLGVKTLEGVKMRTRATMGRCQGGFCRARIVRILRKHFDMDVKDITLRGGGSYLFVGETKDLRKHDKKDC